MHGYPVAAGAIIGFLALRLWHYHKMPRITAWLFGISAFLLTVGVTVWLDALAGLTGTGTGLTVLAAVLLIGGISWYFEGVRKHKHHRIWTPVLGIVFGTAVVLGFALWPRILHKAGKTSGKTGEALSQAITQIHTGHAAAAVSGGQQRTVLLMGVAALVVLIVLALRHERSKGKGGTSVPASSGRPARSSGRRPAAITSGKRR